jgi:putative redox protein
MKMKLKRIGEPFYLQAMSENGNTIEFDASPSIGGTDKGVRPTEALASSLAACSSVDVLMILEKQKLVPADYEVDIQVHRKDEVPAVFESIHLEFQIKGDIPLDRIERAVDLSINKYCTVAKMLEKSLEITSSISLNK